MLGDTPLPRGKSLKGLLASTAFFICVCTTKWSDSSHQKTDESISARHSLVFIRLTVRHVRDIVPKVLVTGRQFGLRVRMAVLQEPGRLHALCDTVIGRVVEHVGQSGVGVDNADIQLRVALCKVRHRRAYITIVLLDPLCCVRHRRRVARDARAALKRHHVEHQKSLALKLRLDALDALGDAAQHSRTVCRISCRTRCLC